MQDKPDFQEIFSVKKALKHFKTKRKKLFDPLLKTEIYCAITQGHDPKIKTYSFSKKLCEEYGLDYQNKVEQMLSNNLSRALITVHNVTEKLRGYLEHEYDEHPEEVAIQVVFIYNEWISSMYLLVKHSMDVIHKHLQMTGRLKSLHNIGRPKTKDTVMRGDQEEIPPTPDFDLG
jgi:hypothetical protein